MRFKQFIKSTKDEERVDEKIDSSNSALNMADNKLQSAISHYLKVLKKNESDKKLVKEVEDLLRGKLNDILMKGRG
jgi:hypothetical protein